MSNLFDGIDEKTITSLEFKAMYRNDSEMALKARAYIEELWIKYEHFSDTHFLQEIKLDNKFQDRFWEIHLGNVLLKKGFDISSENKGPDFKVDLGEDKSIWIEAVTASNGEEGKADSLAPLTEGGAIRVDENAIILRLRNAIESKSVKIEKYLDKKYIEENEPVIIAINVSKIDVIRGDEALIDYAQKSCFGVTSTYTFDVGGKFLYQHSTENIQKHNGSPISVDIFLNKNYKHISAILLSKTHISKYDEEIGEDYVLVLNPYAQNELPEELYDVTNKILFYDRKKNLKRKQFRFKNKSRRFER